MRGEREGESESDISFTLPLTSSDIYHSCADTEEVMYMYMMRILSEFKWISLYTYIHLPRRGHECEYECARVYTRAHIFLLSCPGCLSAAHVLCTSMSSSVSISVYRWQTIVMECLNCLFSLSLSVSLSLSLHLLKS